MVMPPLPLSIYIHLPWCAKKCPYCDFNSHVHGKSDLPERQYTAALLRDIAYAAEACAYAPVESVFFGGGTPSLFSAESIAAVLGYLEDTFTLASDIEITLEANPGAVDAGHFQGYRQAGVNRLSIGVQSFHDDSLERIGRVHDQKQALAAVAMAQDCGFTNINIDVMYGLPGQSLEHALRDLQTAIAQRPQHISWYQLTIEPGTVFHSMPPALPDDERLWQMFERGCAVLDRHGFVQYEVSAYSQPGYPCRHNKNYWQFGDYLGLGAGAHGKLTRHDSGEVIRSTRHKLPARYMQKAGGQAVISLQHRVSAAERIFEFMLNALRLREGVPAGLFEQRTGLPLDDCDQAYQAAIAAGLLCDDEKMIKATAHGYRYLNDLLACFLPESG